MSSESLFIEIDYAQNRKHGQYICGDAFQSQKTPEDGRVITVLSDGLGSGVKANILASMTSRMALRFVASDMDFLHSAEIMMDALPVCKVRKISYATFTIVDTRTPGHARIIEMDNPGFVLLRDGEALEIPASDMASPRWQERRMRLSEVATRPEDRIVLFSDGITQAGLGAREYPLGWREEGCREYLCERLADTPALSAHQLAQDVLHEALRHEPFQRAQDDMTCGVLYFRRPRKLIVLTGPPFSRERDGEYAQMLERFNGKKVICGGTTASILERELGRPVDMDLSTALQDLPPLSRMKGVDLVTEGILTLTRTAQMMEQDLPPHGRDGASRLVNLLRESDIIQFVVGSRINEAHQDPNLPLDIEIRRNIIKRIADVLEKKHLKEVSMLRI